MNWTKLFEHRFFKFGILLILVLFVVPETFFIPPQPGLDPSWQIAVNLAIKHHLVFGRDFIFTYGPMSIISTRLPIAVSKYAYLCIDLYFLGTFFLILRDVAARHFKPGPMIYIFLASSLALYEMMHFWFFAFMIFYLGSILLEPNRKLPVVQSAILSLISLYCKLSLGIVAIVLYVGALVFVTLQKRMPVRHLVVTLALYALLLIGSAFALHVDLVSYVGASLHIINAYNDAMLRALERPYIVYLCGALLIIALFCAYCIYYIITLLKQRILFRNLHYIVILGAISLSIYVVFKNGFVRGEGHNMYFYKSIVLIVPLLFYFAYDKRLARMAGIISWITLVTAFCAADTIGGYKPGKRLYTFDFIPNKCRELTRYVETFLAYDDFIANPPNVTHDNQWKKIIGDKTVDILPTEISIAYFNDLNYNPRPIMQSYSAYDAYLDSLNAAKYRSDTAPDYLFFSMGSIDNRVPFFDETKTKLAILENYELVKTVDDIMLLKRHPGYRTVKKGERVVTESKMFEEIEIPKNAQLLYSTFETEYSLRGKIKRLFFKPPALNVTFTFDDGTTTVYNGIKPILAAGVLSNRFVYLSDEFNLLMHQYGVLNTRVRKMKIEPVDRASGFKDKIKITHTFLAFDNSTAEGRENDSLEYQALSRQYVPINILNDPTVVDTAKIACNLESAQVNARYFIYAHGWAYFKHKDNSQTKTTVVLRTTTGEVLGLRSQSFLRPDVSAYFGRKDLMHTGFLGKTSRNYLPFGIYTLGLMLENGHDRVIQYFDQYQLILPKPGSAEAVAGDQEWIHKKNENLAYSIESVSDVDDQIIIKGWVFLKGAALQPEFKMLFVGEKGNYTATADRSIRPDVASFFGTPLAKNAGFQVTLAKGALPAGTYTIGLDMRTDGVHEATSVSDRTITIP